jgi:ubiquitin-protein ligase
MHEDNRWSPADKSTIYEVHPTDLDRWTVWLAGPAEGPYSSGVWELSVTFPPEYPCRPPTIFFVTPIYHPFVCQTSGKVAGLLDEKTWSSALPMRVILYSLHSMLVDVKADAFEPCWSENKLMQSMIQQLASDRADFDRVARKWTQAHAVGASHFLRRCSPAIRRRALYLMWVARQLEALHGLPADALLDPWVEFVVPLCVFVHDKTRQGKPDFLITAEAKAAAERATAEKEAAERAAGSYLVKPTIFLTSCADDCGGRAGSAPGAVAVPGRAPSRARPVPGRAVRLAVMPAVEALAGGGRGAPSPNLGCAEKQ